MTAQIKQCMVCGKISWVFFLQKVSRSEYAHATCLTTGVNV